VTLDVDVGIPVQGDHWWCVAHREQRRAAVGEAEPGLGDAAQVLAAIRQAGKRELQRAVGGTGDRRLVVVPLVRERPCDARMRQHGERRHLAQAMEGHRVRLIEDHRSKQVHRQQRRMRVRPAAGVGDLADVGPGVGSIEVAEDQIRIGAADKGRDRRAVEPPLVAQRGRP